MLDSLSILLSEQSLPLLYLLGGLFAGALLFSLLQLRKRNQELTISLKVSRELEAELKSQLHQAELDLQAAQAALNQEKELGSQKLAQLEEQKKMLKTEFENLANRILDDKTRSFNKTNRESIESLLKPFREQVSGFQQRINSIHSEAIKNQATLDSEIKKVLEVGLKMGADAQNLTSALKGDSQKRGSWGETMLQRTLEMSGLIEDAHFEKQSAFRDEEGRRKQTDYLVKLPDGKHIVIDSKVSLAAYDRAVSAETDEMMNQALHEHANAVKAHIDDLANKDYSSLAGIRSPSFVLMFMPIEPAYIEALKYEKDLFAYGYEKNVVMVSHTTLIPILRTVANLWMLDRSNREARELGEKAGDIYNQVCKVADRLARLGNTLTAASNHYNDTVTSLVGRQGLHGKVERFNMLSAKASKNMPKLEHIHNELREPDSNLLVTPLADNDAKASDETES